MMVHFMALNAARSSLAFVRNGASTIRAITSFIDLGIHPKLFPFRASFSWWPNTMDHARGQASLNGPVELDRWRRVESS
jgi:hypothetical protein